MKVVSCVRGGGLLFIVGLYDRISRGAREAVVYPAADVSGSSPLISNS